MRAASSRKAVRRLGDKERISKLSQDGSRTIPLSMFEALCSPSQHRAHRSGEPSRGTPNKVIKTFLFG